MKMFILLEELLNELSPQEIYTKYYQTTIDDKTFNKLVQADPQTIVQSGKLVKIGRYAKIIIQLYQKGQLKLEDLPKAQEYLSHAYERHIPIDATKINSLSDIYNLVEKYIHQVSPDIQRIMESLIEGTDYKLLLNGRDWIILQPLTEKGSCYLGVNSEWCTTWGQNSLNPHHRDRYSHYQSYSQQGPLYIIINKHNPNDKYQFHFETKQYMDFRDKGIQINDFFDENPEVMNFFFPSLTGRDSTISQYDWETKHVTLLPVNVQFRFIQRLLQGQTNPLITAIMNRDQDVVNEMIPVSSDQEIELPEKDENIDNLYIKFKINRTQGNLQQFENNIHYLERMKDNSYEEISYSLDHETYINHITEYFKKYYEEHSYHLQSGLMIRNYEDFQQHFFDDFVKKESIKDKFNDESLSKTQTNFETAVEKQIEDIKVYLSFDRNYFDNVFYPNVALFLKFLLDKNITQAKSPNGLLNWYIDHEDIPLETYDYPNYQTEYATYDQMETVIDEYFDEIIDEMSQENYQECANTRKQFSDIYQKIFHGKPKIENEIAVVEIMNSKIDCEDQMIGIRFFDKTSGRKYSGKVKVNNLMNYIQNYKLFENVQRIKKMIDKY